ncbi:Protein-L-isoaspartate O-methyltransferase [hydrothermal vent metagenome]|uniref:Protein-L-isoaspartate O-methyltransferase n=1 Tax=hydrothermal vent metagenome TaxID=652676 RepID=A0A3B0VTX9_9ZZZZ
MNFNTARHNMLFNQIRTWDFVSPKNLDIMAQIQREEFVPIEHRKLAFSDLEIPLAHHEYMMKPGLEGQVLQALKLQGTEKVLEIGTGSGYMTALLALSAEYVTSIDIHQDFTDSAIEKLAEAKIKNCKCIHQDVFNYSSTYKFDVIVFTGSLTQVPEFLLANIKYDGKIFAIVGDYPIMTACIITKSKDGQAKIETLYETVVKPLQTIEQTTIFAL